MKLLIPKILEFLPDWNNRIYTENDAEDFCERHDIIRVDSEFLDDLGEYRTRKGYPVILLHKFVSLRYRNLVLQHEIAHFILHPTISARYADEVAKRKFEKEANFVAAVALIPKHIIETKTLTEIADEFNIPIKTVLFRREIFDTYKI